MQSINLAQFEATLRSAGYSVTRPRQAVFMALQDDGALSMHELIAKVPDVDRASVYRCIELFENLGIVERVQSGWKYRLELSDTFHRHHHHATCLRCGRSFDVPADTRLEVRLYELADFLGFRLERHQLELQGYCSECQKRF